jgi:membrane protein DedA with SNARE-associated domain
VAGALTETALALVRTYGLLALFVFTFLESSMLFPVLPSEAVVPVAAAVVVVDPASFGLFVAVATAGATIGAVFAFEVLGEGATRTLDRLGRYARVDEESLGYAQRWFRRYGQSSVLWGRLLPVLRSVISVPAGVAGMDRRRFIAYSAVGSAAFYAAVAGVVWYGRGTSVYDWAAGELAVLVAWVAGDPLLAVGATVGILVGAAVAWVVARRDDVPLIGSASAPGPDGDAVGGDGEQSVDGRETPESDEEGATEAGEGPASDEDPSVDGRER